MNNVLFRRFRQSAAALICLGFAAGCGGGFMKGSDPNTVTTKSPTRFINTLIGLASASGVDVESPDALKTDRLPYGAATPYALVETGTQTFSVKQTGTSVDALPQPATVSLPTAYSRTVIATGLAGSDPATATGKLYVYKDSGPSSAPSSSNIAVRFINLGIGLTNPVDLYTDTTPVLGAVNITFGNASAYVTLPASAPKLNLHDSRTGAALTLPTLARGATLNGGHSYTVLLTGVASPDTGQEGLDARVLPDP